MKLIAGNCVLETEEIALETVDFLKEMASKYRLDLTFKVSWRKDNRSSITYYQGPSDDVVESTFKQIRREGVRLLTDFHAPTDLGNTWTRWVDVYQLPAYLCTQLSMIKALASTKKTVNIKKGQFLAPSDMGNIVGSFRSLGKEDVWITERGTCFGYHDLVFDPRSVFILNLLSKPIFVDVGHLTRKYGIPSSRIEGGAPHYIYPLARAAIGAGADGLFIEVHPNPVKAMCDAATQINFNMFEGLLNQVLPIWEAIRD